MSPSASSRKQSFPQSPLLTIGIKTYNEERHIEAALASALAAAGPLGGEVVLADSASTDRTVELAQKFPVRIVQLAEPGLRSCGAAAQLAYEHSTGIYFYLLDGDMVLDPAFLSVAIAYLEDHPEIAGVGGQVEEVNLENEEFEIRANSPSSRTHLSPGIVDRLDGGALYRRSAILEVGYFADANLHAFEELELGARLTAKGWKLARIGQTAVRHHGHRSGGYKLLWRRLRSGYAGGAGEVLRASLGQPHLPIILRRLSHIRNAGVVVAWWMMLVTCIALSSRLSWAMGAALALLLFPLVFLSLRRGGLRLGFYSLAIWNVAAIGCVLGLFRRRVDPKSPVPATRIMAAFPLANPAPVDGGTTASALPAQAGYVIAAEKEIRSWT